MKIVQALLGAALALAVGGCAAKSAAWISASRYNYREYAESQVAIMPVMLHRSVDPARFPSKEMQEAVGRQLDVLQIYDTQPMSEEAAASIPFPYTPHRLVEFGKKNHCTRKDKQQPCDAVVGVTIIRMEERPAVKQWSFTGNITFVDVTRPERHWTVAKTWDMSLDSGELNAKVQISGALAQDFMQVRSILPRGVVNKLLMRQTVVVDKGPILNIDIVDKLVDAESNVTQSFDIADAKAGASKVLVDVSAIDDEGVTSLRIVNKNAAFSTYVWGGEEPQENAPPLFAHDSDQAQKKISSDYYENPKFIAERVPVNIAPGKNQILAIAMNGNDEQSEGFVRLSVKVTKDAPAVAVVIATNSPGEGFEADGPRLSAKAATQLQQIVAADTATLPGGARAIPYVNENAIRDTILYNVRRDWSVPGTGTRRVIAFLGRAEMFGDRPYLLLRGVSAKYPEIRSLSINEFADLMRLGISRASIDVCTNNSSPEEIEAAIKKYVDLRIDVEVTAGCTNPIGKEFIDLADDELFDD